MRKIRPKSNHIFMLLACVGFLVLYWPSLGLPPAGDDWLTIHPGRELSREHGTVAAVARAFITPYSDFYRPVLLLPGILARESFALLQALKLGIVFLSAWFAFKLARALNLGLQASALCAAALLFHHIMAIVATELDMWADILLTFTFLLLADTCRRFVAGTRSSTMFIASVSFLTLLSLISKEAGIVCFVVPLLFWMVRPEEGASGKQRGLIAAGLVMASLSCLYLFLRSWMDIQTGSVSSYYSFHFGTNVLANVGLALAALFSPVSTIHVALDHSAWKIVAALFIAILSVMTLLGLWRLIKEGKWRWPVLLFLLAGVAQGPVFLMPHLTESNFSRSLALGLLATMLCLNALWHTPAFVRLRAPALAFAMLWFSFDLTAAFEKNREIVASHVRAESFRKQVLAAAQTARSDTLHFAAIDPRYQGYSVYRQPLLLKLKLGEVPFGVQEECLPRVIHSDLVVVADRQSALRSGADYFVLDDGRLEAIPHE